MSLEAFKEEISKYRAGDHSEFRRINLVYAFQDVVNTLHCKEDISHEILATMDQIVQLQTIDPSLFAEICSDLLEPTIRLQILLAPKLTKSLTQLSIAIAEHSKALDFQHELGNIIRMLKSSENSHPFEVFKNAQGKDSKDNFKTVIAFYVPIILRNVEDHEVRVSMEKMMEVIDLIRFEINSHHTVLGTDIINEICAALLEKRSLFRTLAQKETLKFLFELLDLYMSFNSYKQCRKEVMNTISNLFGDFSLILKAFNASSLSLYNPLSQIAVKSIKGQNFPLSLPSPLSGKSRLLLLFPVGIMSENRVFQKKLLNYSNFYCEQELDPYKLTSNYPQFSPSFIVNQGLESIILCENEVKRGKILFKNLFFKFSEIQRFRFLGHLACKSRNEIISNFLIRVLAQSDPAGTYLKPIMKIALNFYPVIEYILCFSTLSKYLEKLPLKLSAKELGMEKELRQLYEEIDNKMNIEEEKRIRIIEQFRRFFNN